MARQLYGIDYPASELADPIITPEEARRAEPAICQYHGGLIGVSLSQGDHYGRVYFCPKAKMYWRLQKRERDMHSPLNWPKGL